ncbi:expressed unknown protein [Seminavis robusta]|uniref:Transmembrane protein n=1 Tax=Seminavis robusta TaxID=568900 RepID=A0A9N8HK72_9STRA|nr:expressed unknown protein [Seminavis robusta]|eukprot:Sro815_g206460.1 n/a (418) ;mRNA; r:9953-11206
MNAIAANPQVADPPKYDVIADVQSFSSAIDFVVGISLWSPDGIPVDDDVKLKPIKDSMLMSVRMMYCEDFTTNVCVIKDDMLLTSKDVFASPNGKQQGSVASTTLMVPRIGGVLGEGVDPLMWTSWRISFQVVQLGVQYIQELLQQLEEGSEIPVSAETILQLVPEMIKQKVTKDIEKSIREGTFDGLLHGNLGNDDIVSSVVGEEAETFQALLALPPQQAQQVQKDANDEENASTIDLTEVAIYVAIACGIIAMAACGLAYIYTTQTSKAAMAESGLAADRSRSLKDLTDLNVDSSEPSQENDTSDDGVDDDTTTPGLYPPATQSMASPSVDTGTESDTDGDLSTAVASWQVKPRRFVLQEPEVKSQATPRDEDTTSFPTSGSLVAGSVMVGSLGADSVESSLDGWSVNSYDMTWA